MCAKIKDSTTVGKIENEEAVAESESKVDSTRNQEHSPEEFVITGKGYHRKMILLHIVSMGLIWLLLRITFMSSVDPSLLTTPVWVGSILLAVSIHMITFRKFFQTIAETEEILAILKKHTSEITFDEPMSNDHYYENFLEMFDKGQVIFKDSESSVMFKLVKKTKVTNLLIMQKV